MWPLTPVQHGVAQRHTLTLRNAGPGAARFQFVPRPDAELVAPRWLRVTPLAGFVLPGTSIDIILTALVDGALAARLNAADNDAARALDAILVLHCEHGQDFFVTVSGSYEPSAFGAALEWLVARSTPVRTASHAGSAAQLSVPKELWLLLERLQRAHGLRQPALFRERGDATEKALLRGWLDTRADFLELSAPLSIHSVAEVLLEWLASLYPPVIPFEHYADALDGAVNAARCRLLVSHLTPLHYRVWHYLAAFLRARVAARMSASFDTAHAGSTTTASVDGDDSAAASGASSDTPMSCAHREQQHLAALFGAALLRPAAPARASMAARRRAALFLAHFLELPPPES